MSDNATAIQKAYIEPICSVMLVDEEFPSFGDVAQAKPSEEAMEEAVPEPSFKETETALQLWHACHQRGWVCDIKNSGFEEIEDLRRADLVVLDYLLDGNSPDLVNNILAKLAEADNARLVLLYTKEEDLNDVKRKVAAHLRGAADLSSLLANLDDAIPDLDERLEEISLDLSVDDVDDWLRGRERDVRKRLGPKLPVNLRNSTRDLIQYFLEQEINSLGQNTRSKVRIVDLSNTNGSHWVFCRNLFIAIVSKRKHSCDAVFDALEEALNDWKPTPIHLCLAYARTEITRRGFEVERAVPREPALEVGLTYFALNEGPKRGTRHFFEKIWEVLGRDIGDAVGEFGADMLSIMHKDQLKKAKEICRAVDVGDDEVAKHLNAFLCSEETPTTYLRTGTILQAPDDDDNDEVVWICVTPACDLEPDRNPEGSWEHGLGSFRPILFYRAPIANSSRAVNYKGGEVNEGTSSNVLWRQNGSIRCASVATIRTEPMLVADKGRIKDGAIKLKRVGADGAGALKFSAKSFLVLGQLRDQYASSLLQRVGDHASRIGLDFVKLPKS